jgi:hypothetical protein
VHVCHVYLALASLVDRCTLLPVLLRLKQKHRTHHSKEVLLCLLAITWRPLSPWKLKLIHRNPGQHFLPGKLASRESQSSVENGPARPQSSHGVFHCQGVGVGTIDSALYWWNLQGCVQAPIARRVAKARGAVANKTDYLTHIQTQKDPTFSCLPS